MDTASSDGRPAGWYPDPWVRGQRRYWTGTQWSADVFADGRIQQVDESFAARYGPPPSAPAQPRPAPPAFLLPQSAPVLDIGPPAPPPVAEAAPWRRPAVIAIALAAALALLLGGLVLLRPQDQSRQALPSAPTPSPSPPNSPSPTPSPSDSGSTRPQGTIQSVLEALVLHQSDVPDKFTVDVIPGGRSATDQPTLDLCSGTYPSESDRLGRLQVAATDPGGLTQLSTEAVQYSSTDATARAFAEVARVAGQCQGEMSLDPGTGSPVQTTVTPGADRDWGNTPGVDRQAYTVADTDLLGGRESHQVVVYLRRGPLLMGLYFPHPYGRQMPVEGMTAIPEIVKVFEKRLLDTPPGDPSNGLPDQSDPSPSSGGGPGVGA